MKKTTLQKMLLTALFTALMAAGAFLHIGEASLQSMFAVAAGILLGPVWGSVSVSLYILLGAIGLPIFVNTLADPTFGYLLGMILAAFISGILTEKTEWNIWLISALGLLSVYLIGIPYSYFFFKAQTPDMKVITAINMGIVFLPIDFGKWCVVSPIAGRLLSVLRKDLYR